MMNTPIFVTGATGFVGSYLIRFLLSQGYTNITALRRTEKKEENMTSDFQHQIRWVQGDVLDVPLLYEVLEGVEQVYHAAATVSFDPRDRQEMYEVNQIGTANVVNACLENGVKKLIHVSSIAAIGRSAIHNHVSENNKWERSKLNSHYAISKYLAEQEVWRGAAEGLNVAIVNPSVVIGSQYWNHGSGKLFQQVDTGLKFYTQGTTGYVDVRDVVRFMVLLMNSPISEQRFVLNAENLPYKQVFAQIASVLNKKEPSIPITPFLAALAWRWEWLRTLWSKERPLITKETARTSQQSFFYDNKKSLAAFPATDFSYTPIEKSVRQTAEQYLKSKEKGFAILDF